VFEQGRDRYTAKSMSTCDIAPRTVTSLERLTQRCSRSWKLIWLRLLSSSITGKNEVQDADDLWAAKAQLMKQRTGEVFQGLTGVQSYGFSLKLKYQIPLVGSTVEGLVHVSSLKTMV